MNSHAVKDDIWRDMRQRGRKRQVGVRPHAQEVNRHVKAVPSWAVPRNPKHGE